VRNTIKKIWIHVSENSFFQTGIQSQIGFRVGEKDSPYPKKSGLNDFNPDFYFYSSPLVIGKSGGASLF